MTSIRIDKFMGMAPKLSDRLLPDGGAASARNARLLSGELRGIREPYLIHTFSSGPIRNTRRIYKNDGTAVWLGLASADSDIVKGPLVNDSYDRHYWTGEESYVAYNSLARIETGDSAYRLGVPAPTAAASLAVTGGSGSNETRAYTYTFVNSWGEESKPAPIVTETGPVDGSWDLTSLPTSASDMTNRLSITHKRIYRTVTGLTQVSYYFVAEITLATASYSDTTTNSAVALNNELLSFTWDVPDDDLEGLVAHPNGFLVGFIGKDLYFSERYRPHAWPAQYVLSVEHDIVGLAVYNNMIAVLTQGNPYLASGNRPENITLIKNDSTEPCLAKGSIASTISGVLYASPNGLVVLNESGLTVVSRPIMSIEEWSSYNPSSLKAAQYGEQYIGYYSSARGIKFSPSEPFGVFVELDKFDNVDNVITDHTTGQCWLMRENKVYQWEPPAGNPLYYYWKSKEFDFTRPINFGAYMVKSEPITFSTSDEFQALYQAYNTERFDAEVLNPLNFTSLNGGRYEDVNVGTTPTGIDEIPQNKYPIGGGPLYDLAELAESQTVVLLEVYADGDLVYSGNPQALTMHRLPSGFKAHVWQFVLTGNSNIYSFAIAETPKELENV